MCALLLCLWQGTFAEIPDGYYDSTDGKNGTGLKAQLYLIIKDHTVLGYNSLWTYYPSTYYWKSDKTRVFDMYSNIERHYNGNEAVSGMNKEHTVPKSWWGGSTSAAPGNDLYNVIPSDATANSRKSNYPLGVVSSKDWSNDVTTVGSGTVNGYTGKMFEPKDEYKGDFARIYFYMATCYPDLQWDSNNATAMTNSSELTLKSWIIPMLVEWSLADPVDEAEIQRNEDVYACQGNRNPFIDYPVLVDYIWGSKSNSKFILSDHTPNEGGTTELLAGIPTVTIPGGTQAEPRAIAANTVLKVKGSSNKAVLHYCINGGVWKEEQPKKGFNTTTNSEYYTTPEIELTLTEDTHLEAYCTEEGKKTSDKVDLYYKIVDFTTENLFYEDFAGLSGNNTSSSGSSSAWAGNDNFPKAGLEKIYQAGNAVRFGTGDAGGSMTSKTIIFVGGDVEVEIGIKGWTTKEAKAFVSMTGCARKEIPYSAVMADAFETVKVKLEGVSANPTLTIATDNKKERVFVNKVAVRVNNPTAINAVEEQVSTGGKKYNLSGQEVGRGYRGIVISNGKKILCR